MNGRGPVEGTEAKGSVPVAGGPAATELPPEGPDEGTVSGGAQVSARGGGERTELPPVKTLAVR